MKKFFLALVIATSLQFNAPAKAAETYKIDPNHTNIIWHANHFGFSNPSGKFNEVEGFFILDEKDPKKSSVEVTIKIASIQTGIEKFNAHLKTDDFFNVEKYATAKFISKKIELIGKNKAKIHGELTLLGVTKPITLDAKLNKIGLNPFTQGKAAGFSASTIIKRSQYGMNFAVPGISDEVKIEIEVEGMLDAKTSALEKISSALQGIFIQSANAAEALDSAQWKINPQKSKLEFRATQDKSIVAGSFSKFDGKIIFDPKQLASSKINISIDTTSIDSSFKDALETLKTANWLASAQYPSATFISDKFVKIDEKKFRADGKLTIKGKTIATSLNFTLEEFSKNTAIAVGNVIIKRSDFNIGDKDPAKANGVKEEVEIKFTINATK